MYVVLEYACENHILSFDCEKNNFPFKKIKIKRVFYGREFYDITCPEYFLDHHVICNSKSRQAQVFNIVKSMCQNEKQCQIKVSKDILLTGDVDDYCPNVSRYLKVDFDCVSL